MIQRLCVLAFLATACSNTNPNFPPIDLPAELTDCAVDADCAAYELGCCDSCNGGLRVSMRADADPSTVDDYRQTCPAGSACTLVACDLSQAVCDDGTCSLE